LKPALTDKTLMTGFGAVLNIPFSQRLLPLQQQTHERRVGPHSRPLRTQERQCLVPGQAATGHEVGGHDHAAAAHSVSAVNEYLVPLCPLILDEPDPALEVIQARCRLSIRNRLPVLDLGLLRILDLAEVQNRLNTRRRLCNVPAKIEPILDPRIVGRFAGEPVDHQVGAEKDNSGSGHSADEPEPPPFPHFSTSVRANAQLTLPQAQGLGQPFPDLRPAPERLTGRYRNQAG